MPEGPAISTTMPAARACAAASPGSVSGDASSCASPPPPTGGRRGRRARRSVAPGALLWAAALVFVVGVVGVRLDVAVGIALLALGVQAVALFLLASRSR